MLILSGCGDGDAARRELSDARLLFENQQFAAAKIAIDTIRFRYPREVEVLRETLTLMREVERAESERNIAFCDSLMPIRSAEAAVLKKQFRFEKSTDYEDIGNYIWREQTVERRLEQSYIRCGVDEKGEIFLSSIYFGTRPINHTGLRVSLPSDTSAETPAIPYDGGMNYRFTDGGNTTEVVTYRGENCHSVVNFICGMIDTVGKLRIKATYTGGRPFSLYLTDNDRVAVFVTRELAAALSDLESMRRTKVHAIKKIAYLDRKLSESEGVNESKENKINEIAGE
jgi:hypothetical protein